MFLKYGLPFLLIVVILGLWEYSKPSYPVSTEANAQADSGPPPPRNPNEHVFQHIRRSARKGALQSLEQPWAAMCEGEGRRALLEGVNYYYEHRGSHEMSYPKRWGAEGKSYIEREWGTTDDKRIEQLTQDMVARGYLKVAALSRAAAERVGKLTKGVTIMAQPCKG
jgi:hypothetical protein